MFQSPLKTVTEKLKPTQSKSGISSLKFERASDFKKFIGFIKTETEELEKIKLPTTTEIKPKSKSGGLLGLLGLGLLGGLGSAFGGDKGDDDNLRTGSAGGTLSEYSGGLGIASKGIKRVKDLTKTTTTVKSQEQIKKEKRLQRIKSQERLTKKKKAGSGFFSSKKQVREAAEAVKVSAKLKSYYKMLDSYEKAILVEINDLKVRSGMDFSEYSNSQLEQIILQKSYNTPRARRAQALRKQIKEWQKSNSKIYYDHIMTPDERLMNALFNPEQIKKDKEVLKTLTQKERNKLAREYRFFRKQSRAKVPNFKVGGFSIKDSLDKIFTFTGKNTKGFREGLMKNIGKIKIPGSGLIPFTKGVKLSTLGRGIGKAFVPLDIGLTAFTMPFELGILENRGGLLNPKIRMDRSNIVTHLYDMFTTFYNAGVEGLGFDDAHKRLLISKPIDREVSGSLIPFTNIGAFKKNPRRITDAYNEEILEAREAKKLRDAFKMTFDSSMLNNPNIQFPKSNVFAIQKPNGAEFAVEYEYSEGLYDFTMPLKIKLNKQ